MILPFAILITALSAQSPSERLTLAANSNGLAAPGARPWHLKLSYERRDEDGDVVDSGTYEEFWVSAKKYKREYESDEFNQTEFSNERGLFRIGKQEWPGGWQTLVRQLVVEPIQLDIDATEFGVCRTHGRCGQARLHHVASDSARGAGGLPV